jgi:citrate lyase alpha subunit
MLKIKVLSTDGDKVNVNLPLALVKVFVNSGMEIPQINGNDALKNIDFNQILSLCEQGLLGKLVDVQSADGDIVEIWVE